MTSVGARVRKKEAALGTGERHRYEKAFANVVIRELTAVPGVARRLAHRRRCQPGDGGGGRQLRRVVGRRWSGDGRGFT